MQHTHSLINSSAVSCPQSREHDQLHPLIVIESIWLREGDPMPGEVAGRAVAGETVAGGGVAGDGVAKKRAGATEVTLAVGIAELTVLGCDAAVTAGPRVAGGYMAGRGVAGSAEAGRVS